MEDIPLQLPPRWYSCLEEINPNFDMKKTRDSVVAVSWLPEICSVVIEQPVVF
jgi:hypothetical protein